VDDDDRYLHPRYPRRVVGALLEGGFVGELPTGETGWIETAHWLELRARVERDGDLESDEIATVIDLERAIAALQSRHPDAAAVVMCVAFLDFDVGQLAETFGHRRNWPRLLNKAIAWMAAYLAGLPVVGESSSDPSCEHAYRRAK
jgi:hypothetical protein